MNKQKVWFLTLFSLILILSVYYITMPNDILTQVTNSKPITTTSKTKNVNVNESDYITVLEIEKDEERSALSAEYNNVLTNKKSTEEEKNNAYEGLKQLDEIKAKEEKIVKIIKDKMALKSYVKIDNNNVNVVIKKKEHDYTIANDIMRLVQEQFDTKVYVSVKFKI